MSLGLVSMASAAKARLVRPQASDRPMIAVEPDGTAKEPGHHPGPLGGQLRHQQTRFLHEPDDVIERRPQRGGQVHYAADMYGDCKPWSYTGSGWSGPSRANAMDDGIKKLYYYEYEGAGGC